MRLRQIEVFHAIYTSGSVTGAARRLHVSQPSVSKVLAHAEQQLGYALFERIKGKLVPTPEADRLFGLVANVYDNVEQLRQVAENLRDSDVGKIRVAATPALGNELLPTAISSYLAGRADTVFEIETLHHDEIADALIQSRIDIAFAFDSVPSPGLRAESLATSEFVVITPPDFEFDREPPIAVDALAGLPFIGLSSGGPLGRLLASHLGNSGIEFNKVVDTETYHIAKALVANGTGVSIVDSVTARSEDSGPVRCWPLEPPLRYSIDVISSDSMPPSIPCRRFIDHVGAVIGDYLPA